MFLIDSLSFSTKTYDLWILDFTCPLDFFSFLGMLSDIDHIYHLTIVQHQFSLCGPCLVLFLVFLGNLLDILWQYRVQTPSVRILWKLYLYFSIRYPIYYLFVLIIIFLFTFTSLIWGQVEQYFINLFYKILFSFSYWGCCTQQCFFFLYVSAIGVHWTVCVIPGASRQVWSIESRSCLTLCGISKSTTRIQSRLWDLGTC